MQITRKTDYAIRSVLYLASRSDAITMIDEIAREMGIPRSLLAKILQKLVKAGIIRSFRGIGGGFRLDREPGDISLLDVIEAIQGPIAMNACALEKGACSRSPDCVVHPVWVEVRREAERILGGKDFAALAEDLSRQGSEQS